MRFSIRPIRRFVVIVDDQDKVTEHGGVLLDAGTWPTNLDFFVAAVGTEESVGFGVGDRIILKEPTAGRKVRIDGIRYRVVRASDVIAVIQGE